jgi:hypothetical protein
MNTALLMLHMLLAVALIGAITHQCFSAWRHPVTPRSFLGKFASVQGASYTNTIVLLFVLTSILGDVIYPPYRLDIRTALEDLNLPAANGVFEIKEHFAAIGLFMLPAYWLYWRTPLAPESATARKYVTTILALFVWWNFLIGHILNNIKGFGQ